MRIHQRAESIDLLIAAKFDRTYLDDVVRFRIHTRGFEVECDQYVVVDAWQLFA